MSQQNKIDEFNSKKQLKTIMGWKLTEELVPIVHEKNMSGMTLVRGYSAPRQFIDESLAGNKAPKGSLQIRYATKKWHDQEHISITWNGDPWPEIYCDFEALQIFYKNPDLLKVLSEIKGMDVYPKQVIEMLNNLGFEYFDPYNW